MDASTRPPHIRRWGLKCFTLVPVAALFLQASFAVAATSSNPDTSSPAPKSAPASGEMAITTVQPGTESLQLSARFSEDGKVLADDVSWKIRNQENSIVYDRVSAIVQLAVPPGEYQVEAAYGTARIADSLTVQPGTKLGVNFVLNAGGLRILPRVKGLNLPDLVSHSLVYATSGMKQGEMIASSDIPGEVLKVSAGSYRIESRFESSNTVAIANVQVKPGIMSAVEIDHHAGLAKLSYAKQTMGEMQWNIADAQGNEALTFAGAGASLILKPGHYKAALKLNDQTIDAAFDITEGQISELTLGN